MKRILVKLISMTLVIAILVGVTMPMASSATLISPFSDVSTTAVSFNAIWWANHTGLVTGNNGMFLPGDNMTRAQYALVLYRYEGNPAVGSGGMFADVDPGSVAFNAITWANENNIVTGSGGNFLPTNHMTRAQMVLMMHRYSTFLGKDTSSNPDALAPFTDSGQISNVAHEAMRWAVTHGIMTGGNNILNPNGNITRAQVVLILHRYANGIGA